MLSLFASLAVTDISERRQAHALIQNFNKKDSCFFKMKWLLSHLCYHVNYSYSILVVFFHILLSFTLLEHQFIHSDIHWNRIQSIKTLRSPGFSLAASGMLLCNGVSILSNFNFALYNDYLLGIIRKSWPFQLSVAHFPYAKV